MLKAFTLNPLRALRLIKNKTAKGAKSAEVLAVSASVLYKRSMEVENE